MNTFKQRARDLVSQMTLAEKMAQMVYNAPAIERLGVREYNWWNECLHGVAISDEATAKYNEYIKFGYTEIYQGLTMWSPNINIFRDPRWCRGHETYCD